MVLSKKEKGRLKKLHSKSTPPTTHTHTVSSGGGGGGYTGIQTNEDAMEYQLLAAKKVTQQHQQQGEEEDKIKSKGTSTASFVPNGPSIHIRSSNKHEKCKSNGTGHGHGHGSSHHNCNGIRNGNGNGNIGNDGSNGNTVFTPPRITEGDDHRNLLHGLLFHTAPGAGGNGGDSNNNNSSSSKVNKKKNKKRKLHESSNDNDNGNDNGIRNSTCSQSNHTCEKKDENEIDIRMKDQEQGEKQNEGELEPVPHTHPQPHAQPVHNIPSWAVIHNPALIGRIAVLEFNIRSKKVGTSSSTSPSSSSSSSATKTITKPKTSVGEEKGQGQGQGELGATTAVVATTDKNNHLSKPIINSKVLARMVHQNGYIGNETGTETTTTSSTTHAPPKALYTKVRLFQHDNNNNTNNDKNNKKGPRPRNITNVLMYSERKQYKIQQQQQQLLLQSVEKSKNQKVSVGGLYSKLEKLVLSRTQLIKEGYSLWQEEEEEDKQKVQGNSTSYISAEEKDEMEEEKIEKDERAKCKTKQNKIKDQLKQDAIKIHGNLLQQSHDENEMKGDKVNVDWNAMKSYSSISQAENVICNLQLFSNGTDNLENDGEDDTKKRIFVPTFLQRKDLLCSISYGYPVVYALDCEMVRTSLGLELARISLIQLKPTEEELEGYSVILDSYVKPKYPVLDYLTKYSGITPGILEGVNTTLEEIQTFLLALICKDDILIGHSLENDLNALQLVHEKVIDTAVVFRSSDGRKHSLKHLSSCLLHKKIQQAQCGHDSIEDALSSLLLAVRRAIHGDNFMIYDKRNHKQNLMTILTRIRRQQGQHKQPLFFQRNEGPFICLGPNEWVKEHVGGRDQSTANVLQCENINSSSIRAITSYLRQGARSASMLWARVCVDPAADEEYNTKIDSLLSSVFDTSATNTVILIIIQVGYDEAKNLYKQRTAAKDPRSTLGWSQTQEEKYLTVLEKSRYCDAYWVVPNAK